MKLRRRGTGTSGGWNLGGGSPKYANQDRNSPSPTYVRQSVAPSSTTNSPVSADPGRFTVPVQQRPGYQEPLPGAQIARADITGPSRKSPGRLQPKPPYDGYEAIVSHSMTRPIRNMYETTPYDQTFVTSRVPAGGWLKGQFFRQYAVTFRPPFQAPMYDPLNPEITYRANY